MKDFAKTLGAVIDLALDVVNRPNMVTRLPAITELTAAVEAERAVMVEGDNPIRGEVSILLEVLGHIEAERLGGSTRSVEWCMVAGVLLPMVRQNLFDTLLRRPRPATTDHDFRRR